MDKLEVIDGKQTEWSGLWFHPETNSYSSRAINLAALKKFKGVVRLYIRKNKFFNKGENGRPNYNFCIKDANSESFIDLEVEEDKKRPYCEDGTYYTENGDRLYTKSEVQYALNREVDDVQRGYTDNLVEDYIYD